MVDGDGATQVGRHDERVGELFMELAQLGLEAEQFRLSYSPLLIREVHPGQVRQQLGDGHEPMVDIGTDLVDCTAHGVAEIAGVEGRPQFPQGICVVFHLVCHIVSSHQWTMVNNYTRKITSDKVIQQMAEGLLLAFCAYGCVCASF